MAMYVQDYDETFPVVAKPSVQDTDVGGWPSYWELLQPYAKNTRIFACPSNPQIPEYAKGYTGPLYGMVRSYAMNGTVSTDQRRSAVEDRLVTRVWAPALRVVAIDAKTGSFAPSTTAPAKSPTSASATTAGRCSSTSTRPGCG